VLDSGIVPFCNGQLLFHRIDDLAMTVCTAPFISNDDWASYMEGMLRSSQALGTSPTVAISCFSKTHATSEQRRMAKEFLSRRGVDPLLRLVIISDSAIVRGSTSALGWMLSGTQLRALHSGQAGKGMDWLREVGNFDRALAASLWSGLFAQLKVHEPVRVSP
jgi:hypothetical protein